MLIYFAISEESNDQLNWFLGHLRAVYPVTEVLAIGDGTKRTDLGPLRRYGCHYTQSEKLKVLNKGGQWWHRALMGMLKYEWSHGIKVDPDTMFWRPFKEWPTGDVFGRQEAINLQGGCQGFRREAAERLVTSRIFLDPQLQDHRTWAPWEPQKGGDYLSTDLTLAWACRSLGLKVVDWPECGCWWKDAPSNTDLRFAVTHPHKRG